MLKPASHIEEAYNLNFYTPKDIKILHNLEEIKEL